MAKIRIGGRLSRGIDIKNLKKIANAFEWEIANFTNKILGSEFGRTKQSGGSDFGKPGDMFDRTKSTPLSRRCIEIKKHSSKREFRATIFNDIEQSITQTPAGLVWILITKTPEEDGRYFVIQDYEDYLLMDIQGQMLASKKDLRKTFNNMRTLLRAIKRYIDKLEAGA